MIVCVFSSQIDVALIIAPARRPLPAHACITTGLNSRHYFVQIFLNLFVIKQRHLRRYCVPLMNAFYIIVIFVLKVIFILNSDIYNIIQKSIWQDFYFDLTVFFVWSDGFFLFPSDGIFFYIFFDLTGSTPVWFIWLLLFIWLFACLFVYLFVCLPVCRHDYQSVYVC